jgi:hypothetical protein
MRYLLFFFLVFSICKTFAQSKKEQILILSNKFDSLNKVIDIERIAFNLKQNSFKTFKDSVQSNIDFMKSSIENLKIEITWLTTQLQSSNILLKSENQNNINLQNQFKSKSDSLSMLKNELEKLKQKINDNSNKDELIITKYQENYENCRPKYKYNKSNCSSLELSYPLFESKKIDVIILNKIVGDLLFSNSENEQLNFYELKENYLSNFKEEEGEYYSLQWGMVGCTFHGSGLISLISSGALHSEGAPSIAKSRGKSIIFDIIKSEVIEFSELFIQNSENTLRQLIINNLDSSYSNVIPESGNAEELIVDFDNVFISDYDYENGICFFVGPEYLSLPQISVCVPFKQCKSILKYPFNNIFNE